MDDILVWCKMEHDKNLENVLHQIRAGGMILNMKECHFRFRCIKYLGHGIIKADLEKRETFPSHSAAQLLSFK